MSGGSWASIFQEVAVISKRKKRFRQEPLVPKIPRADRARVATILLKGAVKRQDWPKVSTAIWLLESLEEAQ